MNNIEKYANKWYDIMTVLYGNQESTENHAFVSEEDLKRRLSVPNAEVNEEEEGLRISWEVPDKLHPNCFDKHRTVLTFSSPKMDDRNWGCYFKNGEVILSNDCYVLAEDWGDGFIFNDETEKELTQRSREEEDVPSITDWLLERYLYLDYEWISELSLDGASILLSNKPIDSREWGEIVEAYNKFIEEEYLDQD
jgi:hypothetical protein